MIAAASSHHIYLGTSIHPSTRALGVEESDRVCVVDQSKNRSMHQHSHRVADNQAEHIIAPTTGLRPAGGRKKKNRICEPRRAENHATASLMA
jgi:hypothetical protein